MIGEPGAGSALGPSFAALIYVAFALAAGRPA
jgi:hypothetical protein